MPLRSRFLLAAALACVSLPASASPSIPIQGVVRDNAGQVVEEGAFQMTFRNDQVTAYAICVK